MNRHSLTNSHRQRIRYIIIESLQNCTTDVACNLKKKSDPRLNGLPVATRDRHSIGLIDLGVA